MAHHIFLESKYPENTKNLFMFGPPMEVCANMIWLFLEEIVGFVNDVLELRTSKTLQYYTMMLQSPDKNYRTVSYRKDLRVEFAKAAQDKSPVKMTAVK